MEEIDKEKLPRHIAIIMDGNGRWAKKKSLNRISGHIKGVDAVREVVTACRELGIKVLTLYALSTENLRRPKDEVTALMGLLKEYLLKEREEMIENNIRLCAIGRLEDLPPDVRDTLQETIQKTEHCDGMILNLALSYGGRAEILHAARGSSPIFKREKLSQRRSPSNVSPNIFGPGEYPIQIFSSGRAGNFASPTSFSGRSLTQNYMSPKRYGQILIGKNF